MSLPLSGSAVQPASSGSPDLISQVSVRFVSRTCPPVPDAPFTVPTRLGRLGLSEIINHLLQGETTAADDDNDAQHPQHVPYDFLVNGEFLRTTLAKFLTKHNLSGESGIVLEYVESLPTPQELPSIPHPDWVSSITTLRMTNQQGVNDYIVSSCYDGMLRIFDNRTIVSTSDSQSSLVDSSSAICSGIGHLSAIKHIVAADTSDLSDAPYAGVFSSVGKDRTLRVWKVDTDGRTCNQLAEAASTESIDAVDISNQTMVTGGWSRALDIYSLDTIDLTASSGDQIISNKRQKLGSVKKPVNTQLQHLQPTHTINNAHTDAITNVVLPMPHIVYSSSLDYFVHQYDLQSSSLQHPAHSIRCPTAVTAMDYNVDLNILLTGHNDSTIRAWDCRIKSDQSQILNKSITSHKGWISSVQWQINGRGYDDNENRTHLFASTSYDHTVKLFDFRSSIPLHTLNAHQDKALTCEWYRGCLLTGGADSQLHASRIADAAVQ